MDDVVGEKVMGQVERNREWSQIDANLDDNRPGQDDRAPHGADFRAFASIGGHWRFDAQSLDISTSTYATR
jgi:hypothetical protein